MGESRVFGFRVTVPAAARDANGHAGNVAYVQWMQDAAVAHAEAAGCAAATAALGATWVVRSHNLEYKRPAYVGEELVVRTWVVDLRRVASLRKYEVVRGEEVVAVGETEWVFVDAATGRPRRIPEGFKGMFGIA